MNAAEPRLDSSVNQGLPPLELGNPPVSRFEFWPLWVMYLPVVIYWLLLSLRYRSFGLPLVVNPGIDLGGMIGESKSAILDQAGPALRRVILPFAVFSRTAGKPGADAAIALQAAKRAGLDFPLVVKPDQGCRGSGVSRVASETELEQYLAGVSAGEGLLLQQLAPFSAEAGVFYMRHPGEESGRIVSLTLKYQPHVTGDGQRTLEQLVRDHPRARYLAEMHCRKHRERMGEVLAAGENFVLEFAGSHCRGSIFRNGNGYITPAMEAAFDHLLKQLPEFYYGRLDVKFRSLESLQQGSDFCIIEINGVSSEQTHIWDSRTGFYEAQKVLLGQYRTLFAMGNALRRQGHKVPSAWTMIKRWFRDVS